MALILFLQDVAAGRDFMHRYCIVMTWLIWQRVDLDQREQLCVTALCESVQSIKHATLYATSATQPTTLHLLCL